MRERQIERSSRRVVLAAFGLAGAVALAACPPPDADYQHVSDTAVVREEHPGRVADPSAERVPHGTSAGDTAGRADPHQGAPTGTRAQPAVPPEQQP